MVLVQYCDAVWLCSGSDPDMKDAVSNKLLQCMEHLSYICDPEKDGIYSTETQNLFR